MSALSQLVTPPPIPTRHVPRTVKRLDMQARSNKVVLHGNQYKRLFDPEQDRRNVLWQVISSGPVRREHIAVALKISTIRVKVALCALRREKRVAYGIVDKLGYWTGT